MERSPTCVIPVGSKRSQSASHTRFSQQRTSACHASERKHSFSAQSQRKHSCSLTDTPPSLSTIQPQIEKEAGASCGHKTHLSTTLAPCLRSCITRLGAPHHTARNRVLQPWEVRGPSVLSAGASSQTSFIHCSSCSRLLESILGDQGPAFTLTPLAGSPYLSRVTLSPPYQEADATQAS